MDKTPLIIDNVEVAEINKKEKSFTLLVHINAPATKMYSPEIQKKVADSVFKAVSYLVKEGFLPEQDELQTDWKVNIAGVCHPTK